MGRRWLPPALVNRFAHELHTDDAFADWQGEAYLAWDVVRGRWTRGPDFPQPPPPADGLPF